MERGMRRNWTGEEKWPLMDRHLNINQGERADVSLAAHFDDTRGYIPYMATSINFVDETDGRTYREREKTHINTKRISSLMLADDQR